MEPKRGSEGGQDLPKEATWDASPGNRGGRRRVGLLGGSFDPVHAGHLFVAQAALEGAELDEVVFVPVEPRDVASIDGGLIIDLGLIFCPVCLVLL